MRVDRAVGRDLVEPHGEKAAGRSADELEGHLGRAQDLEPGGQGLAVEAEGAAVIDALIEGAAPGPMPKPHQAPQPSPTDLRRERARPALSASGFVRQPAAGVQRQGAASIFGLGHAGSATQRPGRSS